MQNKKTTAILLSVLAAAFYAVNVPFSKLLLNQSVRRFWRLCCISAPESASASSISAIRKSTPERKS